MDRTIDIQQETLRLIRQKMEEKGLTQTKLAKVLQVTTSSVFQMLNSNSMSLHRLEQLSRVLGYNFFAELSKLPGLPGTEALQPDHSDCNARILELEIENRTLLKILKDYPGH
jgi:transcriptional regulator with XRE-family HTH domain